MPTPAHLTALARVKACSERAVLGSLLLGFLVRDLFTLHAVGQLDAHGQPVYTDIPVSQAAIPDLSCRNLCLQLCRGLPGAGANTRPSAAVAAVLAAHPDLRARLEAVPRYHSDTNMVDHVGKQRETVFSNMLTLLFAGRLKKSVSLAGAKAEVALQQGMLGLEEGEEVDHDWLEDRAPRPPTPYALTLTSKCRARHVFVDTLGLYGLMRDAGMLEVANRWDALLPNPRRQKLASPKHTFAQIVHTDGAEWLGVDPGKTNMATVAHEERSAAGTVVSVMPQLKALSQVNSRPSSLASYRRFADTVLATCDTMWAEVSKPRWANAKCWLYCGKQRVMARFWDELIKQAKQRWPDRILALAYGAAGFDGGGTVGCRGVPVSQMLKEALRQFPAGRVLMVDEFRTSRVSSAYSNPSEALPGEPPEFFRWLRPVYSEAKRSRVRGFMFSTSNNIRWDGRPAMPKPGRLCQEWVYVTVFAYNRSLCLLAACV
ncbi:hypothetical protein QJQ45_001727 [Haematococcus lacustris]|nr:hypothetical protein QJQ45_001727 [Haematococcus lacustris]